MEEVTEQDENAESGSGSRPEAQAGPRTEAFITGCAYGALLLVGLALGLVESFTYSLSIGFVPVAALSWSLFNFGGALLAGYGMGSKLGAAVPAAAWLVVLFMLLPIRPEGDAVIANTLAGYAYIFGGTFAALAGIMRTPSAQPWLLIGADPRIG